MIIPHSGFGSIKFAPTLTEGWNLTHFDSTADTKTAETLGAITGLLEKAKVFLAMGTKMAGQPQQVVQLSPGLYRFEFGSGGHVIGLVKVFQLTRKVGGRDEPVPCPGLQGGSTPEGGSS